ncbi:unnamed protein product [Prunus armeniaca]|uniref:No apical meristem-associated C-terminal domain-containing protein n=1 Tax=Prunus armeniaca TaxID=36596 RepID=A0A6J5THZ9_PRUAR|nr:unnamed protein product [Prunus armeniaca]
MRLEELKLNLNSLNNRNHKVCAKPNSARSFKRPRSSAYDSDSDSVLSNATTPSDEINLSPRRAARVAMLKARFAGTIFKAKQEVLYSGSNGLENTEDEIKKFRAAEMMKANDYIKEQRQRDREAARLALEEMERNVVIDDNFKTMRDFEMLISGANC